GQSSTLTGTLAGQVVMEGFVHLRLRPWVRRLLTRSLALLPALVVIGLFGQEAASPGQAARPVDENLLQLLILTQVILSLQLPFAVIPLVQFTADRKRMGEFANPGWLRALAWGSAGVIVVLNAVVIVLQMQDWAGKAAEAGWHPLWVYATFGP